MRKERAGGGWEEGGWDAFKTRTHTSESGGKKYIYHEKVSRSGKPHTCILVCCNLFNRFVLHTPGLSCITLQLPSGVLLECSFVFPDLPQGPRMNPPRSTRGSLEGSSLSPRVFLGCPLRPQSPGGFGRRRDIGTSRGPQGIPRGPWDTHGKKI